MESRESVINLAYRSVKWSVLASLLPRFITPLSTIILAGLLMPTDFGIVAASTLVVSLAQVVVGLGMGAAVVQRRSEVSEAASIALGLSLAVALFLYAVVWWVAPLLAVAYRIPDLTLVLRVTAIALILSALSSIPVALLQRDLQFKRLFWIGALPQIISAFLAVGLASLGGGYWALVFGQLAGQLVSLVLVWRACTWRPNLIFHREIFLSLVGFSSWIVISSFQSWLFLYGDNALAGYFFGAKGLGVYSLGFNIANLVPGTIVSSVAAVAYPAFCALQSQGSREVGLSLLKIQRLLAIALLPLGFGLSVVAIPFVSLLYGSKWSGLGMVMAWLAIMPGLSHIWSLNSDAYRAIGQPRIWTHIAFLTLVILVPILMISGPWGLPIFVVARFAGAWFYPVLNIIIGGRALQLSVKEQVKVFAPGVAPTLLMFLATIFGLYIAAPFEGLYGWAKLLIVIFLGAMMYVISVRIINRQIFAQLVLSARRLVMST